MTYASTVSKSTGAVGFSSGEQALDDGGGAADAGLDLQCFVFTVVGAGTAFDATITILDEGFFVPHLKYLTRTYFETAPTACTFFRGVFQSDHVRQIFHRTLHASNLWIKIKIPDTTAAAI